MPSLPELAEVGGSAYAGGMVNKPKWKYFAIYADTGAKATPDGSKKTIEGFASFLSKDGRNVCIKRYQNGADAGAPVSPGGGLAGAQPPAVETKVCYVSGARSKKR